jgi:hypothetical protein
MYQMSKSQNIEKATFLTHCKEITSMFNDRAIMK